MSGKERGNWSKGTAQDVVDAEPIEGFADLDDDYAADEADFEAPAADAASSQDRRGQRASAKAVGAARRAGGRRGISSGELGVLFSASILVAGAGVGSACLLAVGASPTELWRPDELLAWRNYMSLTEHPLNLLALIVLGTVVLTLLGSRAIAKAANGANDRFRAAEDVLGRLTALRLTDEDAWQAADFSDHPAAANFATEALGAWRLQGARQKRYMGLEGELRRLEKALSDGSRQDLTGRFDNPAVGSLADEMVRYFDERAALARELTELKERDADEAAAIVSLLQDARAWNRSVRERVGAQSVALERVAARMRDETHRHGGVPAAGAAGLLADIRNELEGGAADGLPEGFGDLVDQGGKLAFQLSMEVSRLGPRAERLLPLAQSLEELTTNFRRLAEDASPGAGAGLDGVRGKLADLADRIDARPAVPSEAGQDAPAASAARIAASLTEITAQFQPQAERLLKLGENFAALTGAAFDPDAVAAAHPDNPTEVPLAGARPDPFAVSTPAPAAQDEMDPFAAGPAEPAVESPVESAVETDDEPLVIERPFRPQPFATGSPEPVSPAFTAEPAFAPEPAVANDREFTVEPSFEPEPETFADAPQASEPPLSSEPEKVYDLDAFGAEPVRAEPEEEIYDLAEFGAVRLDAGDEQDEDRIYDLAEFGAVPVA